MPESKSVWNLIAIPAAITLAVTILRLVGELQHWPSVLFSTKAGGGAAIVGISWLPIIFGPYFAIKLVSEGKGPTSAGKAIGFAVVGFLVLFGGAIGVGLLFKNPGPLLVLPFALMLVAALVPGLGWKELGKTLLAYAFAARIPILIVMYLAISGNGGAGWGTHYDRIDPSLAQASFAKKYVLEALLPQMTLWIGWTVVIGAIFGSIAGAIKGRRKPAA